MLQENVVLNNNDIIFVPRSFMGEVNDLITKMMDSILFGFSAAFRYMSLRLKYGKIAKRMNRISNENDHDRYQPR